MSESFESPKDAAEDLVEGRWLPGVPLEEHPSYFEIRRLVYLIEVALKASAETGQYRSGP